MSKNIIIAALAVLVLLLFWDGCNKLKQRDNLLSQLANYKISEQAFQKKRQADSSTIVQQNQTIMTQKEAERLGLVKLEGEIKKLQSSVYQLQRIKRDTLKAEYVPDNFADTSGWYKKLVAGDYSKMYVDSLMKHSVLVPKRFSFADKWTSIGGRVLKTEVAIDSITMDNESTVQIGWKGSGFLKLGKTPVVEIENTNPYLSTAKLGNVVVQKPKGILQSKLFWFGVGIFGGFLIK